MSWNFMQNFENFQDFGVIEMLIILCVCDIGGFEVCCVLFVLCCQMVGLFIFFDYMGLVEFLIGGGIDVCLYFYIGFVIVIYLYCGEFQYCDFFGINQMIYFGEVNWMIVGNGVMYFECILVEMCCCFGVLYGIQIWVVLFEFVEDGNVVFEYYGCEVLLMLFEGGKQVWLIFGSVWGEIVLVKIFIDMFYVDVVLEFYVQLLLFDNYEDRGVYVIEGQIIVVDQIFDVGCMMVFCLGDVISLIVGLMGVWLMVLGGEMLNGLCYILWNFVVLLCECIEVVKEVWWQGDWVYGCFQLLLGDDVEFILWFENLC